MKFYAELYGHIKPKEERKKSKKRAALKGEQPNSSAMDEDATAAAQEDNKKKKEEYLTFMKDLCGADGEGKHPELPLQVDLSKVNRCRESHMLKASNAAKLMRSLKMHLQHDSVGIAMQETLSAGGQPTPVRWQMCHNS